jgi:beta-lactamase regulating signal transducer with metallopeptidase domain
MEANLLRQLSATGPAELLIASIWQGLLLTALAWAALRFAPSLRASTRFTLWLIVFTLVALLPCFAAGRALFEAPGTFAAPVEQTGFSLRINIAWAFVIEGLWLLASLFSLARLWASVQQMRSLWRNSTPVPFATLSEEIQSIVTRPGSRPVGVRLSDAVDAPSVIGFFHPAVVIPRTLWNELAPGELKQIILHEKAHLDRADDWTNLLQKLLRALCPLNPALFWAERHLCLERERACDDAVLDVAGDARAYATCLTKLAETRLVKRAALLAPGMWKRHSELAGRVENILHRRRSLGPLFSRSLVAASLFASLFGVLVLQRCPGVVSFASSKTETAASRTAGDAASFDRAYQDRYPEQYQARYQEAVFHPTNNPAKPAAQTVIQPKHHAARSPYSSSRLQFLELRSAEDGTSVTLILFTVEVPRSSSVTQTSLATPDNWIVFQI